MKSKFFFLSFIFSIFVFCSNVFAVSTDNVQVFYNAKIYTAEPSIQEATAFVVKDGKFIYVGNDEGVLKYGEGRNLKGQRVIPGMMESHAHPVIMSSLKAFNGFYELKNVNDPKKAMKELKSVYKSGKFKNVDKVLIHGPYPPLFINLTAKDIDAAIPDKSVVIYAGDGHSLWMNTLYMKEMNINKDTKDFIPGVSYFKRDAEGNPTGFFAEPLLVLSKMLEPFGLDKDKMYNDLKELIKTYNSLGYTSIADAGAFIISNEDGLKLLKKMEDKGELTMHFYPMYYWGGPTDKPISVVEKEMIDLRNKYTTALIKPDTLKMFADGVIETRTALLRDNYPGTEIRGAEVNSAEDILMGAEMAKRNDFNIHVHTIGDGAIENVLRAYEMVGPMTGRKITAHGQVVPSDLVKKYVMKKDVVFQTTPSWSGVLDREMEREIADLLGRDRFGQQYPIGRLMNNGVIVTFGSDSIGGPVFWDAFLNIYYGVRRGENDSTITVPSTNDEITVAQGIDGYTINGAKQVRDEGNIGSIAVGKSADFVILDKDVFNIPTKKLLSVKVLETWFRGKNVYKK